jgi:hypothetical protein
MTTTKKLDSLGIMMPSHEETDSNLTLPIP